jgi:hypothetical protein
VRHWTCLTLFPSAIEAKTKAENEYSRSDPSNERMEDAVGDDSHHRTVGGGLDHPPW